MHGLYMQGAKWDSNKKCVEDSAIGVPIVEFPVIWLEPILEDEVKVVLKLEMTVQLKCKQA